MHADASSSPPVPGPSKGRLLDPILIALLAMGIRLLYLRDYAGSPFFEFLHLDPQYYHAWGTRIAAGEWLGKDVFEMAPLYSYGLAAYFLLLGKGLGLLHLLQFALGSATAVLTTLLGRRIFGRGAGNVAGIASALYGPFLFYEGQVMKEFLTPFFSVLMLLLFYRGIRDGRRRRTWWLLAGISIGLAALVRDNFLLLLPLLGTWAVLRGPGEKAPARLAGVAFLAAGTLAALLPAAAHNFAVSGEIVLTTSGGGEVFYIGNGPYANGAYVPPPWVRPTPIHEHEDFRARAREIAGRDLSRAEASRFWWREGLRSITDAPGRWLGLEGRKALLFLNNRELPDNYSYYSFTGFSPVLDLLPTFGFVLALAVPGLLATAGRWRELLPLYLAGGGYMISVMLFFNFARFRLPFMPVLFLFAGAGAVALNRAGHDLLASGGRGRGSPLRRAALLAGAGLAAAVLSGLDLHSSAEEPFQDRLHLSAAYAQAGEHGQAESILRETIRDAEDLLRARGWSPGAGPVPGGVAFSLALHAAWRDLAGVLMAQGREEEGIRAFRSAIPFDPTDADLLQRLGGALGRRGDHEAAAAAYRQGLALRPGSFTIRFDLATALYESGDPPGALRELARARELNPSLDPLDLADWHVGIGTVLLAWPERLEEAREHLAEGLRLNPSHPQAGAVRDALSSGAE